MCYYIQQWEGMFECRHKHNAFRPTLCQKVGRSVRFILCQLKEVYLLLARKMS